mgnify:CR=1 FL=1
MHYGTNGGEFRWHIRLCLEGVWRYKAVTIHRAPKAPCFSKAVPMPFFDYRCLSCDHTFEVLQKASDPAPAECPACKNGEVKKLLSAPSIQSSGGGGGGGGHVHGPGCRH